jgi:hypothetical protein
MKIVRTTKVADKVLKQFISRWKSLKFPSIYPEEFNLYLEPYQNGREHGWSLSYKMRKVAFSEYRNSDQIVVYCGTLADFHLQGNVPSDKVYKRREMFSSEEVDFENVVQFIIDQFV